MNKKYFRSCMLLLAFVFGIAAVCETSYAASAPPFTIKSRAKTSATIKIKKKKGITGYQIFVANSKKGRYKQVGAARGTTTYKITRLKKNKTYYIKIRSYKTRGYRISLGKFSKPVKVPKYKKKKVTPTKKPSATKKPSPAPTGNDLPDIVPSESNAPAPDDSSIPSESGSPVPEVSAAPVF